MYIDTDDIGTDLFKLFEKPGGLVKGMNIIAVCTRNFADQIGDLNVIVYNEEPFSCRSFTYPYYNISTTRYYDRFA